MPVYGCAPCLEELWFRTTSMLDRDTIPFEIVFVDDASLDDAATILAILANRDSRVKVVSLDRNQGQLAAIAIGLSHATGQWVAIMDGDLQDPPEALSRFLVVARQGKDIVVGRPRSPQQRLWRRVASRIFLLLVRLRHGSRLVRTHGVFSVLSRRAVIGYLRRDERSLAYLPVIEVLGFPIVSVDYDRAPRATGVSSYSLGRLSRRAWRLLKARPIRRATDVS